MTFISRAAGTPALTVRRAATGLLMLLTTATAWADGAVYYIGEDGHLWSRTNYTLIENAPQNDYGTITLTAGQWYVVSSYISVGCFTVTGDGAANIILCDGKNIIIKRIETDFNSGSLNIYGQGEGTGEFNVDRSTCNVNDKAMLGNLTVYGGRVAIYGNDIGNECLPQYGIIGDVTMYGGSLTAAGGHNNNVDLEGIFGNVTLSWMNATDRFYANSIRGTVTVAPGKAFADDEGNVYSGSISSGSIAGKTLQPAASVTLPSGITAVSGLLTSGENHYAKVGQTVTVTATQGYTISNVTVTLAAGIAPTVTNNGDGTFSFTMPAADVSVKATITATDWATVNAGTAADPYMIYNKDQLNLLAYRMHGTNGQTYQTDGYEGKYFKLANDITYTHTTDWDDATSTENNYVAIGGQNSPEGKIDYFKGHFDGNNMTISGIRIYEGGSHSEDYNYQGLFGFISGGGTVHDLTLADARITGWHDIGGIAGHNTGTITRCHVAADVAIHAVQSETDNHGGIAGYNYATVSHCTSAATLTIPDNGTSCNDYGAIAGYNYCTGTLTDNFAIGATVPALINNNHGAICGYNNKCNNNSGTLARNYYYNCTVAGVQNATGKGCNNADVTADDGAIPVYAITLGDHLAINSAATFTHNETNYFKQDCNVVVEATAGYILNGITVTPATGSAPIVTATGNGTYRFTMPPANVTVSADITTTPWTGSGTKDSPYVIMYPSQLDLLAYRVNGTHGETRQEDGYQGKYFKLANDITYTHTTDWDDTNSQENNYEAIGGYYNYFKGHFDGNNKTVSGIRIYKSGTDTDDDQGLFGRTLSANIHDLTLADARITGYDCSGGIVGENNGTVTRCRVASDVTIHAVKNYAYYHGGIAGQNREFISHCISAATLTIADNITNCDGYGAIAGENTGDETCTGALEDNLAIGATVPAAYNNWHGAICGGNIGGTLARNYYYNCTVAGEQNATGKGCNDADVTDNEGAVPALLTQSGDTYTIGNGGGWGVFCEMLQDNATYNRFSGKTVKLNTDITVSRAAGSDQHDFCGTFDGDGNTLTFNYGTSTAYSNKQYIAPFHYVSNVGSVSATIKNLHVAGDIYTSAKYAAGIVAQHWGTLNIENCRVSTVIHSSVSGDGTHGGIEAANNGTINITGCLFDGKLLTTNGTTNCSGFVGFGGTVNISNSIYARATLGAGETEPTNGSATFSRTSPTISNSYYTRTLGTAQGKQMHSITAGQNVVTLAHSGTATEYDVSGITAYSINENGNENTLIPGLKYGDVLYAGNGDAVSLTLSHTTVPAGYSFSNYTVSAGTLEGTTLTMPNQDVTISAPYPPTYTITYNLNGGTVATANPTSYNIETATFTLTNPTRTGYTFTGWTGSNGNTPQTTVTIAKGSTENRTYTANWTPDPAHFSVSGDEYTIHTAEGWGVFCDLLSGGETFSGKTVKLDANIGSEQEPITRWAGSKGHEFQGTFDGGGHTLTVNYSSNSYADTAAPFSYVSGATIQNLIVTGNCGGTYGRAAGIVGESASMTTITNCISSVTLSGGPFNGGISIGGLVNIEGCIYNGRINTTDRSGGFVGYAESTTRIANSLFDPQEGSTIVGGTFYHISNTATITNSYYTRALGTAQGTAAYAVTTAPANLGAAVTGVSYTVLTAYANGILFDGKYYVAPADVTLYDNATNDLTGVSGYVADVTLQGRKLYTDGAWNTLCLPFNATKTGPLAGATIKEIDTETAYNGHKTGLEDGTLYLNFRDAESIVAGRPYIVKWDGDLVINSEDDWNTFASNVNNGTESYQGKLVKLAADISVSTMVGTSSHPFRGIFDGAGHTLNVSITDETNQGTAPFRYISDATIRNLKVTGTVTGNLHCAGLVGFAKGTNAIRQCEVAASVICSGGNHSHCGGILGHGLSSATTLTDCLFSGTISGATTATGIIYGWGDGGGTHTIVNCLANGTYTDCNGIELLRKDNGTEVITNCYKTQNIGSQGTYTTATGSDLVALLGDGWQVSGENVVPKLIPAIVNPVFVGVTINASAPTAVTSKDGTVSFTGSYSPVSIAGEDRSILFLGASNTLYYPNAAMTIKACRAYFQLTEDAQTLSRFVLNFDGDGEAQGIKEIDDLPIYDLRFEAGAWYTIDGVKLDGKPTKKGLYIHGGRKVVVK